MHVLIMVLAVVAVGLSIATAAVGLGRGQAASPRSRKRAAPWAPLIVAAMFALLVVLDVTSKHVSYMTFATGGFGLMMLLLELFRRPERFSDAEAAANYAADRQHCGQCEYDLTGNQSGICPECGWRIPSQVPSSVNYELGAMWWRPWRIERLESWRRTFWETVLFAAMFAGAAVFVNYAGNPLGGIVLGLLGLACLVNVGRVFAYGRRRGKRS